MFIENYFSHSVVTHVSPSQTNRKSTTRKKNNAMRWAVVIQANDEPQLHFMWSDFGDLCCRCRWHCRFLSEEKQTGTGTASAEQRTMKYAWVHDPSPSSIDDAISKHKLISRHYKWITEDCRWWHRRTPGVGHRPTWNNRRGTVALRNAFDENKWRDLSFGIISFHFQKWKKKKKTETTSTRNNLSLVVTAMRFRSRSHGARNALLTMTIRIHFRWPWQMDTKINFNNNFPFVSRPRHRHRHAIAFAISDFPKFMRLSDVIKLAKTTSATATERKNQIEVELVRCRCSDGARLAGEGRRTHADDINRCVGACNRVRNNWRTFHCQCRPIC